MMKRDAMDKRVEKTDAAIDEAVLRLMEGHRIAQITVSAIAREANIDRNTFYARYASPEEAYAHIAKAVVEETAAGVEADMRDMSQASDYDLDADEEAELRLKLFFGRLGYRLSDDKMPHSKRNRWTSLDELYPYFVGHFTEKVRQGMLGAKLAQSKTCDLEAALVLIASLWAQRTWMFDEENTPLSHYTDTVCDILLHGLMGKA